MGLVFADMSRRAQGRTTGQVKVFFPIRPESKPEMEIGMPARIKSVHGSQSRFQTTNNWFRRGVRRHIWSLKPAVEVSSGLREIT